MSGSDARRRLRGGGRREREEQREHDQREPHACSASSFGQVLIEPRLRDREALQRRDPPLAVDQERLRIARDAELAPVGRGRGRAGSGTSPCARSRKLDRLARSRPACRGRGRRRPWPRSARASSAAAGPPRGTDRTTRPTRSAPRPCPCSRRASRCPPGCSHGSALTGAAGRWPLATASSSVVSVPLETTPYASSPTSAAAARVTGQKIRMRTPEGYPRQLHSRPARALSNGQDVGFPSQRWGFDSPRPLSSRHPAASPSPLGSPRACSSRAILCLAVALGGAAVLDPGELALELAPGGDPLRGRAPARTAQPGSVSWAQSAKRQPQRELVDVGEGLAGAVPEAGDPDARACRSGTRRPGA